MLNLMTVHELPATAAGANGARTMSPSAAARGEIIELS
jgi:hypothetical protein